MGRPAVGLFREGSHHVVDIVPHNSTHEQQLPYDSSTAGGGSSGGSGAGRESSRVGERPAALGEGRGAGAGAAGRVSLRQRARLRLGVGAGGRDEGEGGLEAAEAAGGRGVSAGQQEAEDGGLRDCVAHHPRINLAAKLIKQVGFCGRRCKCCECA